jgi:hypothetical protein
MNTETVKAKRGRKSKKDLLLSLNSQYSSQTLNNLVLNIQEVEGVNNTVIDQAEDDITQNIIIKDYIQQKPLSKKRGRKPKGGKIIQQLAPKNNQQDVKTNVILHLKCFLKDLQMDSNNDIESFNFSSNKDLEYNILPLPNETSVTHNDINDIDDDEYSASSNNDTSIKDIYKKLKQLEQNLHINNVNDKKSACFWCTYDFDNPAIYIPRYFLKNSYHVYGCFCSPECAVAHLMEENIDSSTKFERYHFINHLYAKIYNYNKNIKPAPNPYYMLEKYYGNLSIQEYRALFKNERLFLIVDKPLTRILPELHEDNDDFILNNKIIPSNNYQIKKIQRKTQTKTNILNEKFGIV